MFCPSILGGEWRSTLSIPAYILLLITPGAGLAYIATIPTTTLSTYKKQILSIPLLVVDILTTVLFRTDFILIDFMMPACTFIIFCRFLELIWTGPLIYGREAYTTKGSLHTEFWSCIRYFPKPAKKHDVSLKKNQIEYVKDKKFYNILPMLMYYIVGWDILATWLTTFTRDDIHNINRDKSLVSFIVYYITLVILNNAGNVIGCIGQLIYVLYYEGGTYSSGQWRDLMNNPMFSTSISDYWTHRWQQIMRPTFLALVYRPVSYYCQKLLSKYTRNTAIYSQGLSVLAVFTLSGAMHEYIAFCNLGWPTHSKIFLGEQQLLFMLYAPLIIFEKALRSISYRCLPLSFIKSFPVQCIQRLWAMVISYIIFSRILETFTYSGFRFRLPFTILGPQIIEFLRQTPALHGLCGSLLTTLST
ncbi:hypothetical protein J3Q64DRAFT_1711991 [Phycomyces blakesleeanus]|uniref:Wax synthase domain-containing protein n=2 Tax=Phycomyces blakesleeanus TaxID=4837 RepID=A0A163CYJ5_PHYB8|nr:hypothetical protein PHYBLDRAFT_189282 [Phycomyces blakesleeanus NRRL 1555(-)]OAD66540.1 hypothetical protein PHYBLDRAFT_189282 [Phycomyces blakesleeanus NRRL 1555(-)]|eukprot:XP_018284580.1 hypothetical protein PHYBLDRAFT_189282 [Phycomyces blakesleeanus NRRL 1555(-)]